VLSLPDPVGHDIFCILLAEDSNSRRVTQKPANET